MNILKFDNYLEEMAALTNDLDLEFIKRAEVVSSFNLTGADFSSTKYKQEIQFLIKKHFFPKFDLSTTAKTFNEGDVNRVLNALKAENNSKFLSLLSWTPKGVGPGEVLLYFAVDDVSLGGGSSAGLDITSGGKGYEVKAVDLNQKGYFINFRIGGTANISSAMKAAARIKVAMGLKGRDTEINNAQIAAIKNSEYAAEWEKEVETPYKIATMDYFSGHDTIFIINKIPAALKGNVFTKSIKLSDIELDTVTNGTIKPKIIK